MKVLVVDDEPLLVRVLVRFLNAEAIDVVSAENGVRALARLAEGPVDLVLCDVRMPVMDGPTMLATLRARDPHHPPVVFLTGYADSGDAELAAMGAVEVQGKPVEAAQLLALVRRCARRPA